MYEASLIAIIQCEILFYSILYQEHTNTSLVFHNENMVILPSWRVKITFDALSARMSPWHQGSFENRALIMRPLYITNYRDGNTGGTVTWRPSRYPKHRRLQPLRFTALVFPLDNLGWTYCIDARTGSTNLTGWAPEHKRRRHPPHSWQRSLLSFIFGTPRMRRLALSHLGSKKALHAAEIATRGFTTVLFSFFFSYWLLWWNIWRNIYGEYPRIMVHGF